MSQIKQTTLGKSCEFFNGKAHEKDIDTDGEYIVVNSKFISQDGRIIKRTKEQMFPLYNDDIVMVMSDVPNGKALSKCFIVDKDDKYSLNQRICCIRSEEFDTKYLYYQLNRNEYFLAFNNGENQTNLRKDDILNCPLIKPSMDDQQHIVSTLDEAFEAIDQAKANAKKNLVNAKELFESYSERVFEESDGEIVELDEVTEIKDGTHDSPKYVDEGIPFVTQKNVRLTGLTLENTKFIKQSDHEKFYKRSNVAFGDILISMIGANRGMAAIVDNEIIFSIKNVGLIKSNENINNRYLLYYLSSRKAQQYVKDASSGGAQEFIGLTKLRAFPTPVVSIKKQNEIVDKLDAMQGETQQLETLYQKKIDALEELKKSILQKAFRGELETEKEK